MDLYQFFGFLIILKDSIKLLYKNGKLMILVTTISLLVSSIFFSIFDFSSFSLMRDMLVKESLIPISSSSSAEFSSQLSRFKDNFLLILTIYISFVFSYFSVTFLSTVATIIVSDASYNSKSLSLKDLCFRIAKSLARPFFTAFYTTIFVIGYVFFVISMATPMLMSSNMSILGLAVLFGGIAYIFYLYLSSVWLLGLVVSVIDEESYGIEALGKSAGLIKGQKLNGFLLNIVLNMVSLGVYLGSKMIKDKRICGFFLVNCSCLVKILTFVAYTNLYFGAKKKYGEEIELNMSDVEYGKLPTLPFGNGVP